MHSILNIKILLIQSMIKVKISINQAFQECERSYICVLGSSNELIKSTNRLLLHIEMSICYNLQILEDQETWKYVSGIA
jgi:hypothetical protein